MPTLLANVDKNGNSITETSFLEGEGASYTEIKSSNELEGHKLSSEEIKQIPVLLKELTKAIKKHDSQAIEGRVVYMGYTFSGAIKRKPKDFYVQVAIDDKKLFVRKAFAAPFEWSRFEINTKVLLITCANKFYVVAIL